MHNRNQFNCLLTVFILWFGEVSPSGWKPIVPPADYYATMPTTCVTDCVDHKYPTKASDAAIPKLIKTETHIVEDSWSGQSSPENLQHRTKTRDTDKVDEEDLLGSGQTLNFDEKPVELNSFAIPDIERRKPARSPSPLYQSIYPYNPIKFESVKTIIPKPVNNLYYGSSKTSKNFKFLPSTAVHSPGENINVFIQPDDDALKPYSQLSELYKFDEHCTMYKVSFQQNLYYQYIQYKTHMPDLKEFTICLWFKLHNHSHAHPLFSYSTKPHHKEIYMWVSNLEDPALLYMKVMEQTIFRLNYPIKLFIWYHTCQSWNGYTGEWQVWLNGHRIARGFHNLLVGHKIPGKGISISGQEYQNSEKTLDETFHFFDGSKGLQGELTMLQMYKVALTAGKANNDHRHHHSHHTSTTPEPEEESSEEVSTKTEHPLLENGQLKTHVNILELVETLKKKGHIEGLDHHHNHHDQHDYNYHGGFKAFAPPLPFLYHDTGPSYVHLGSNIKYGSVSNHFGTNDHNIFKRENRNHSAISDFQKKKQEIPKEDCNQHSTIKENISELQEDPIKIKAIDEVSHPATVQKIKFPNQSAENDTFYSSESFSESNEGEKEDEEVEEEEITTVKYREGRARRHNSQTTYAFTGHLKSRTIPIGRKIFRKKRPTESKSAIKKIFEGKKKEPSKRYLVLPDPYSHTGNYNILGHLQYSALPAYNHGYNPTPHHGQEIDDDYDNPLHALSSEEDESALSESPTQHELAEDEVNRIMTMCSGCHMDPFRKVAVISWRITPKKIYSGALLLKAKSECENF